jgi:replicative superfamily II helicase
MTHFVTITKAEFEEMLQTINPEMDLVSGNEDTKCWEYVYEIPTPKANVAVRIYSTVDKRTGHTRDKGEDAIRVVFWDTKNDRPLGKGKKILRVEGATTVAERIAGRVEEFLNGANAVSVIDFDYVRAVLEDNAPYNNFASSLLENLDKWGSLTDGQLAYVLGDKTPKGWDTMEAKSKSKNPDFWQNYMAVGENGDDDTDPPENGPDSGPTRRVRVGLNPKGRENRSQGENGATRRDTRDDVETTVTGREVNRHRELVGAALEQQRRAAQDNHHTVREDLTEATSLYPFWEYPFERFNPVQTATLPLVALDNNLIIGANTSAGKTVCAELLMDHTLMKETMNRVIYLSPLKSLTQEKYDDWQKRFPGMKITILTGDYTLSEKRKQELAASNIIVMTSEMCDSRTRRMHSEKNFWLKEVGLVIVDESHILSTDRGHAVEVGIMRFTSINRDARVLFLSATMPNCDELAAWMTKLNGKATDVVYSTWRPVVLEMNYIGHPVYDGQYMATQNIKRQIALDVVESKPDEKFLVFVHDKGTGRHMVKRLEAMGIPAHFHSADLNMKDRLSIEKSFEDRDNGLRVLVSTSTLAWGRNLPARNVVIVGVHRGIQDVDELDIIQMAGRAGRYGIDDKGTVYLICPAGNEEAWEHRFGNPRPVTSVFYSPTHGINRPVMAFHVLAEIENREIDSVKTLTRWYMRSLCGHQNPDIFDTEDAEDLFDELRDMEMLDYKGNYLRPAISGLGRVSAWLYFSPYDVFDWYQNFSKYFDAENAVDHDDMTLAWALGDVKSNDWGYVPKDVRDIADRFAYDLRQRGIRASGGIVAAVAAHELITGGSPEAGSLKIFMRNIRYDINRIVQAIGLIDSMFAKWEQKPLWAALPQRVMYGVSEEMVELTTVPGIGGATARKLYERGIHSIAALAMDENLSIVMKIATPTRAKKFMMDARRLVD